jgi:hypothetical protein
MTSSSASHPHNSYAGLPTLTPKPLASQQPQHLIVFRFVSTEGRIYFHQPFQLY